MCAAGGIEIYYSNFSYYTYVFKIWRKKFMYCVYFSKGISFVEPRLALFSTSHDHYFTNDYG